MPLGPVRMKKDPPHQAVASELAVSRLTVRKALDGLVAEGLL